MARLTARPTRSEGRRAALVAAAGAVLTATGDVLILGRPCSGTDFDQAAGMVPPHVDADRRWQSLWNGAVLSARRIHAGTMIGMLGIGLLEWVGMRGMTRVIHPGVLRDVAASSAAAFAVSGALTHLTCGVVISAYRRASLGEVEPAIGVRPSPRSATGPLAISAVASLAALAVFSLSLSAAALRGRSTASILWSAAAPFPCVLATLVSFGLLPTPIGGYARPASISIGMLVSFAVAAASAERPPTRGSNQF